MNVRVRHKGGFDKTDRFLMKAAKGEFFKNLDKYGEIGVNALMSATPVDSGETAQQWGYYITHTKDSVGITWTNDNIKPGMKVPIALLIQYGHGTRGGGYVQGYDYINPALRHVFDEILRNVWREVVSS